jgi:radical SAM superfamily enzyme
MRDQPTSNREAELKAPTRIGSGDLLGSRPMTPERHRRYVHRFITEATPYTRQMCELEMLMPTTFVKKEDGSLEKTRDLWPEWAKMQWENLNQVVEIIKERAAREA